MTFKNAISVFDHDIELVLCKINTADSSTVQEIRLRINAPLTVSRQSGNFFVGFDGQLQKSAKNSLICTREHIEKSFLKMCEYSIHSHQSEIIQGFVTAQNGCRVGICGTALIKDSGITNIRDISSLCLRIFRNHRGCSIEILREIAAGSTVKSTLICGEPSSGKTSLLKDLAYQLTCNNTYRVSVVDERGELSAGLESRNADVMKMVPKALGAEMMVRSLAPEVIIFDELGCEAEVDSVINALNSGVSVITTVHGKNIESIRQRPQIAKALRHGIFEKIIFLEGRQNPGKIREILEAGGCID